MLSAHTSRFLVRALAVLVLTALVVSLVQVVPGMVSPGGSRASASAATGTGGLFVPVQGRIVDTRNGTGGYSTPMSANVWRSVGVDGLAGIPSSGVSAVAVDFTVVAAAAAGNLHADKDGVASPNSTVTYVNFGAAQITSNSAVIAVGDDGKIQVQSTQATDLVIDVEGYYTAGATAAGGYVPTAATTIVSTATGLGGVPVAKIATGQTLTFNVGGVGSVPANASAVMLDLSPGQQAGGGWLTAYPAGTVRPTATLDWPAAANFEWTTPVSLPASGQVSVYVGTGGPINLNVVVEGYFTATTAANPDGQFTPAATRVYDSRQTTTIASAATRTIAVGGINGVPVAGSGITAVAANIAVVNATASGHLQAFADNNPCMGSACWRVRGCKDMSVLVAAAHRGWLPCRGRDRPGGPQWRGVTVP